MWEPAQPLEHLVLDEGTTRGPVVALGSPRDKAPPYGVARGYFENRTWQQGVAEFARNSFAIVMCFDDTDGVWWEVDHIRGEKLASKTLFLIHPSYATGTRNIDATLALVDRLCIDNPALRDGFHQKLPAAGTIVGFFLDNSGIVQVGTSSKPSRFAYLLMLRWFLRTKFTANST